MQRICDEAKKIYDAKVELVGAENMHQFERAVMLQNLDHQWREHLASLDHLRQGIHLRGYAQKNPKQEYKREAFDLFAAMLERIKYDVTKIVLTVQIRGQEDIDAVEAQHAPENVNYQHAEFNAPIDSDASPEEIAAAATQPQAATNPYADQRIGRNDPCPCGSGKKYKQCHGRLA